MAKLSLGVPLAKALQAPELLILAPQAAHAQGLARKLLAGHWSGEAALEAMLADLKPGAMGKVVGTFTGLEAPRRVLLGVLPDSVSRHASPTRNHAIASCAAEAGLGRPGKRAVIMVLDEAGHWLAAANALGRALPLFDRKSGGEPADGKTKAKAKGKGKGHDKEKDKDPTHVSVTALDPHGDPLAVPAGVEATVEAARWAAWMVDHPTAELTTAGFVDAVQAQARALKLEVQSRVIAGDALLKEGLGGIHAVGRAAEVAPRLLILQHGPKKADATVALVGKGVVYDTGGLSIKTPTTVMSGMKGDMGGGAAVVGAFFALCQEKLRRRVVCLVPLAENAVGPASYRPDDILHMHSGKTVEINNTDAEGRLLLADGVSYAARTFKPDLVIDAATLTGAQLVATGKRHAAVVSNREGLEQLAIRAGRATGDLVHPLPFAPEFYQSEFESRVADMKNSVKDRMNAQSSCAAQFVWSHISDTDVPWLHVDLAGPAFQGERGTGFGVALLAEVARSVERDALAR